MKTVAFGGVQMLIVLWREVFHLSFRGQICLTTLKCPMVEDEFEHFLQAQEPVYDEVVSELSAGQKRSHWMWFFFPQLQGLGHSPMALRFAMHSLEQARRYAQHPELGQRLRQCTRLVTQVQDREILKILGFPDDLKFHSSMTLFSLACSDEPVFNLALQKYFRGEKDAKTIEPLKNTK